MGSRTGASLQQEMAALNRLSGSATTAQRAMTQLGAATTAAATHGNQLSQSAAQQAKALQTVTQAANQQATALRELDKAAGKQREQVFGLDMQAMIEESRRIWPIRSLGYGLQNIGRTMLIQGAAQAAGMAALTNEYLKFDYAAIRAGQAMELQTELQPMLRDAIMETAEAVGRFDAEQVAEGLRTWAAGIGAVVRDSGDLNRLMEETIAIQKLAALNNVEFASTVDTVGGIMHEYGLTTRDVNHITEVLNYTAAKSFANVDDLGDAFKMVGPIAAEMGISFEETAAAFALLSDANITATMAGRAFRQMNIHVLDSNEKYNRVMNESLGLTGKLGDTWQSVVYPEGRFIGLPEFIDLLAASTENLTDQERGYRLAAMATANELPTLVTLVQNQIKAREYGVNVLSAWVKVQQGVADAETMAYKRMVEDITGLPFSLENAHALMTGMWEEYVKGDTYRADRLKRQWESVFIDLGEVFTKLVLPPLEDFTDMVMRVLDYIEGSPALKQMASNLAAVAIAVTGLELIFGRFLATLGSAAIAWTNYKIAMSGIAAAKATSVATGAAAATGGIPWPAGVLAGLGAGLGRGIRGMPGSLWHFLAGLGGTALPLAAWGGLAMGAALPFTPPAGERQRRTLEEQPEPVQQRFHELFGPDPRGVDALVARTREAQDLLTRVTGQQDKWLHGAEDTAAVIAAIRRELGVIESEMWVDPHGWWAGQRPELTRRPTQLKATGLDEEQLAIGEVMYRYTEDAKQIEREYLARRQDMVQSYNDWRIQAEEDLGRRLAQANEDYDREGTRRLDDYNRQVAKVNEEANRREAEQERRHLDNLRKAQRDHRDRLIDLLEEGDVRGIVKEMRRYRTQREDMASQAQQDKAQRADDRNRRLQEMDEQFRLENARRDEDFRLQQQRAEEELELERQRRKKALDQQIIELTDEKDRALTELDTMLEMALAKMMGFATALELDVYPKMYKAALKWAQPLIDLANDLMTIMEMQAQLPEGTRFWIPESMEPYLFPGYIMGSPIAGSRATGGYVDSGLYTMGERGREFVLNADTTRLLEASYGRLDQDTFRALAGESFSYAPYIDLRGATGVDLPTIRRAWREDMNAAFEGYATRRRTPVYGR